MKISAIITGVLLCLALSASSYAESLAWSYLLTDDLPSTHLPPTYAHKEKSAQSDATAVDDAEAFRQARKAKGWIQGEGVANFAFDGQPKWLRYQIPPGNELRILP